MDRINSAGTVLDANNHRIRAQKNLSTGTNGTELDYNYDNVFQEEIVAGLIEATGQEPSNADPRQVSKAIAILIAAETTRAEAVELAIRQTHVYLPFTSTATVSIPAGIYYVWGSIIASGGGGGGSANAGGAGAGGGGSHRIVFGFPVVPGDTVGMVIPAATGGGGADPTPGSNGGAAAVYINSTQVIGIAGGSGGAAGNGACSTSPGAPGTYFIQSGFNIEAKIELGDGGGDAFIISGTTLWGGQGGKGGNTAPTAAAIGAGPTTGGGSAAYGTGGGGSVLGGAGGNGAQGFGDLWY